jgi:hypothetical protein
MDIIAYLKGKVGFNITEAKVGSILLDRGISSSATAESLTEKQRQLLYADCLMFGSTIMSNSSRRGSFSESISNSNGKDLRVLANSIYKKYDDDRYDSSIETDLTWIEYE